MEALKKLQESEANREETFESIEERKRKGRERQLIVKGGKKEE